MKLTAQNFGGQREFRFIGLSRSGNHAIINWAINQLNGRYCFLNCTEPKHNPFATARSLSEGGKSYRSNIPGFDFCREQQGDFSQKDYLLYSHEDCFLGAMHHPRFRQHRNLWLGDFSEMKDVLILRDVFNLFASRIKANLMRGHHTQHGAKPISILTLKRIWKQHAREFLGEKKYLKNKVVINYNQWAADAEYRRSIAGQLGIPFSDKGFEEVAGVAGGSSFDGTKYSGKAPMMKVNSRWKEFRDDGDYWELFDEEMLELNLRIFGEAPSMAPTGRDAAASALG